MSELSQSLHKAVLFFVFCVPLFQMKEGVGTRDQKSLLIFILTNVFYNDVGVITIDFIVIVLVFEQMLWCLSSDVWIRSVSQIIFVTLNLSPAVSCTKIKPSPYWNKTPAENPVLPPPDILEQIHQQLISQPICGQQILHLPEQPLSQMVALPPEIGLVATFLGTLQPPRMHCNLRASPRETSELYTHS